MSTSKERILLVEGDPEISDLIARQALEPLGYQVRVIDAAPKAIQEAIRLSPDVIIADLNLPGLSGKDMLVALSAQGLTVPVIVIAEQGLEGDVIQAFRLGASDYLGWPIREAEVVSAVERALTQVRAGRERELLARQLKKTNQELHSRVRELTTILNIGKVITSLTDRRTLFDKIIEGTVYIAEADKGWLLLRKGNSKTFVLSAQRKLPKSIASRLGEPWDDGISSLVVLSGETLSIHGTPLERFKVSRLGKSALVVPVKAQKEVVGLLVVMREESKPFGASSQTLLETLADYVSISLVNMRLFQAVEDRALSLLQKASSPQNLVTVNLVDLARQAVARFQELAKEKSVTLRPELLAEPVFVMADLPQIAQVFDALLSNAIQLNLEGNVVVRIERDKKGNPHAVVQDTGPGIAKEHQVEIAYSFFQLDSSGADEHETLDMGLVLAEEIIKAHGGQMWVESQPGKGSVFHFTLQSTNLGR